MSRTRQMIELQAPAVMREHRPERFTVKGFTCPVCNGNGWHWGNTFDDADVDSRGWAHITCSVCGGTGEVDAEVTVEWKKQKGGAA